MNADGPFRDDATTGKSMPDARRSVILYLDIDGVLNAPNPTGPKGWDHAVDVQLVDRPRDTPLWNGWIRYAPQLIAALEQLLIDFRFLEIVWNSTWVAHPLYLDRLTAQLGALQGLRKVAPPMIKISGYQPPTWKLDRILDDMTDHPGADIIWIDDSVRTGDRRQLWARCKEEGRQLLLITPPADKGRGITPADIECIRFSLSGQEGGYS
ncbi:HAD domain-containing protein [Microbacterium capsulatum]|uniref:HAD domain-containing protein n=1 Tax=Microbacterium capsulatum TaxID=3041921 RepID=A0ABU0XHB0_9MICO|nr:HAD domain-containing protein [Microbacterium sp. ASV81]MDQ4214054.1 HAD domain-containing protein [Microbacterium sp. ASV81]